MIIWILDKQESESEYSTQKLMVTGKERGHEVRFVYPEQCELILEDKDFSLYFEGKKTMLPNVVISRMGSSSTYFSLSLLEQLQQLGVRVLNTPQGISRSMDKFRTLQILASKSIPIPKTLLAKFPIDHKLVEQQFGFPVIVKCLQGSKGKGVSICKTRHEFIDTMDFLEASKSPSVQFLIQEFISSSKGRDLRAIVIGSRVIGVMLRQASKGNFKANVARGAKTLVYEKDAAIDWLSTECTKILNLDIAGIDILFSQDEYVICEINSSPGFQGFEKATGIDVSQAIYEFVELHNYSA
ncbi:RimK family alpha-L-glutamate ligase [Candidatus Woesearchaeota archaeon]|nr:RimK family alpha-L-glutamate ligase [Candidatus Woesearchaeota archaeon]